MVDPEGRKHMTSLIIYLKNRLKNRITLDKVITMIVNKVLNTI